MLVREAVAVVVTLLLVALVPSTGMFVASPSPSGVPTASSLRGWSNLSNSVAPPAAAGTMMAYDGTLNRFVWFGGWNGITALNQTWELDGANGTWTELHPPRSPPARGDAALVYDPVNQLFYLFGGWTELSNGSYVRLNDTWSFSLALDRWAPVPASTAPSPRSDAAVAFDPSDDVLVLFGGFSGTTYLGDTWAFLPPSGHWAPLRASGSAPGPRADGRMTYDGLAHRFILFGGNDFSGPNLTFHHLNDTWTFSYPSQSWALVPTVAAPPARDYAVQAFDPVENWTLLFGGFGNRTILNDLWAYSAGNESWWPLSPPSPPPPRYAGTGGFDDGDHTFLIVGGLGNQGLLNDTWRLGATLPPSGPAPFPWPLFFAIVVPIALAGVVAGVWLARSRRG